MKKLLFLLILLQAIKVKGQTLANEYNFSDSIIKHIECAVMNYDSTYKNVKGKEFYILMDSYMDNKIVIKVSFALESMSVLKIVKSSDRFTMINKPEKKKLKIVFYQDILYSKLRVNKDASVSDIRIGGYNIVTDYSGNIISTFWDN